MKVLIISHNPISSHQNMGKTMLSLFSSFDASELCQLFIYPATPDVEKCHSYLRISDVDALRGIFRFKVHPVKVKPAAQEIRKEPMTFYKSNRNRSHTRELARDFVWKLSPWFNAALKNWLAEEKPTHIFVAPGRGKFLYEMTEQIAAFLRIPVITYICDDYYNLKKEKSLIGKYWQNGLKKKIRQLIQHSDTVITICDELSETYSDTFGCHVQTIMSGAKIDLRDPAPQKGKISAFVYMGNISLNRYQSLIDIAKTLEELSSDEMTYYLDIYTQDTEQSMLDACAACKNIRMRGFVTGDVYQNVFDQAEAFIHVEAFDEESIDRVKHSFSSKIADILSSGKPIFVYGPEQVASVAYLKRNEAGCVVTDRKDLSEKLSRFITNASYRTEIIAKEIDVAKRAHHAQSQSNDLRSLFMKESS